MEEDILTHYDLIVIGSGAGMNVASQAYSLGLRIAVIDKDPMGGTCLNRGCIPSKVWTTAADLIREAEDGRAIGVNLSDEGSDYSLIRKRTWEIVLDGRRSMEEGARSAPNLDFYNEPAEFTGDMELRVGRKTITADRIVIASGARPHIPPIEGIEEVGYLTNRNVFELQRLPASVIVVGGGYIAAEFGHFLSAMGVEVTILGRNPRLLKREDGEVSNAVLRGMSRRMRVLVNFEALSASRTARGKGVVARDRGSGKTYTIEAEEILVAAGREANSDVLHPERTGVQVDEDGWIVTNEFLETTRENVWAMGDCVDRGQFRHTANYHSELVYNNAFGEGNKVGVEEHAIPSAVFSWPQVGSVGMTVEQAIEAGYHAHVGKEYYYDTAKGFAMGDEEAFAKVVVDATNGRILGAHVVGPQASVLVQLVVDLMNAGDRTFMPLARAQIIHPALSEVVVRAFGKLQHPEGAPGGHGHAHGHAHDHANAHGHDHANAHGHAHDHGARGDERGTRQEGGKRGSRRLLRRGS